MIISHQLQYTYLYTTGTQIIQVLNGFYFFFFSFKPNLHVEEEPIMGFVFTLGGCRPGPIMAFVPEVENPPGHFLVFVF